MVLLVAIAVLGAVPALTLGAELAAGEGFGVTSDGSTSTPLGSGC
jgi:hypothetical protein